jgi:hypothetical protein
MLKLLQPGIQPLGQFDIEDGDIALMKGGEVGIFEAQTASEGYAADVNSSIGGPAVQVTLGDCAAVGALYGLVDEGIAGYGTMLGKVIGATVGQGTGMGTLSTSGVVVVGPSSAYGSGKVTLWTKPGLYGTSVDAWYDSSEFTGVALNAGIYGKAEDATNDGKLTTTSTSNGIKVAIALGLVKDTSLVSTSNYAATGTASTEFVAMYLLGVQG